MSENWIAKAIREKYPNKLFLSKNLYTEIIEAKKKGYTMTDIWKSLVDDKIINCKYDTFAQRIRRWERKKMNGHEDDKNVS